MRIQLCVFAGLALVAVADPGCSGSSSTIAPGAVGPGGTADGGTGSGAGASGNGGLTRDNACGIDDSFGKLSPVNMLVMFDRSGSMKDNDKWTNASAALTAFFEDPAAADLGVALRFFPHEEPVAGCNKTDCDSDACEQPLVELAKLMAAAAPTDAHEAALVSAIQSSAPGDEGGGTPIFAALEGALHWAAAAQAVHTDAKTVVVFVTDGKPNGCDENFDHIAALAQDALSSANIATYAIGLQGSSEAQMDQLAQAGGTQQGIFIGAGSGAEQELLDALNAIRGQNQSCDIALPGPVRANALIDPSKISVSFVYGSGAPSITLAQVATANDCGKTAAWYYDDPKDPQRLFLCPHACNTARAANDAGLQILLGCSKPDQLDCGNQPDLPECIVD